MYFLLVVLVWSCFCSIVSAQENAAIESMKTAYCYSFFSKELQNPSLESDKVIQFKIAVDSLLPRYRAALEYAKGKLLETALEREAEKARTNRQRGLSAAEYFMVIDSCQSYAIESPS